MSRPRPIPILTPIDMTASLRFALAVGLGVAVSIASGCATPPKPRELDTFEQLKASPLAQAAAKRAPNLIEDADKLLAKSRKEWESNKLEESRRDALLGGIKVKTAIALVEQEQAKARTAAADAELRKSEDEYDRLAKDLQATNEQVALMQKLAETRSQAAQTSQQLSQEQQRAASTEKLVRNEALARDAADIPGMTVQVEKRGRSTRLVLPLRGLFKQRLTTLAPGKEAALDPIASLAEKYSTYPVQVIGHTDNRGRHDQLVAISLARAQSVLNALVARNVDAKRLTAGGLGPDEPVSENRTSTGRAQNNRIEIVFIY